MEIIRFYGARTIFLLFYENQDNESEAWKLEIGEVGPMFTYIYKIKGYMGQQYPYFTIWEQNIVAILQIHGARAIFYYFEITKTLNVCHMKQKWVYLKQYSPIKIYQRLYGITIPILYNMGENIVILLQIYGDRAIP